ncbi:protein-disulfide reductase DsbD domain-containing protein [Bartonella sp. DGB2]|uniref:protein-disulfide reductase DsbD domain-containing protein n=1 Tax=Bartonella sp. DGB2 TaxID=3388426 RepID=UPI0039902737
MKKNSRPYFSQPAAFFSQTLLDQLERAHRKLRLRLPRATSIGAVACITLFLRALGIVLAIVCYQATLLHASSLVPPSTNSDTPFATPWREETGGAVRLIIDPNVKSDGLHAMIEIHLKDGWKTYWRNPGDSGMPPAFDFSPQRAHKVLYPAPRYFFKAGEWAIGYQGELRLPFVVEPPTKDLKGEFIIGMCKDICIPFHFPFDVSNPQAGIKVPSALLESAWKSLPQPIPPDLHLKAALKATNLYVHITTPKSYRGRVPDLFLDGGALEIGPAKHVANTKFTYQAPVYFNPEQKTNPIFFTLLIGNTAFSGHFTPQKTAVP